MEYYVEKPCWYWYLIIFNWDLNERPLDEAIVSDIVPVLFVCGLNFSFQFFWTEP